MPIGLVNCTWFTVVNWQIVISFLAFRLDCKLLKSLSNYSAIDSVLILVCAWHMYIKTGMIQVGCCLLKELLFVLIGHFTVSYQKLSLVLLRSITYFWNVTIFKPWTIFNSNCRRIFFQRAFNMPIHNTRLFVFVGFLWFI